MSLLTKRFFTTETLCAGANARNHDVRRYRQRGNFGGGETPEGRRIIYSALEIIEVSVVHQLISAGITPEHAQNTAKLVAAKFPAASKRISKEKKKPKSKRHYVLSYVVMDLVSGQCFPLSTPEQLSHYQSMSPNGNIVICVDTLGMAVMSRIKKHWQEQKASGARLYDTEEPNALLELG